jgi:hypothetical protein
MIIARLLAFRNDHVSTTVWDHVGILGGVLLLLLSHDGTRTGWYGRSPSKRRKPFASSRAKTDTRQKTEQNIFLPSWFSQWTWPYFLMGETNGLASIHLCQFIHLHQSKVSSIDLTHLSSPSERLPRSNHRLGSRSFFSNLQ